ncbi:MAG TPA: general secretion pathway protein GspK [Verrucomicrobiae bacterium]|jgi:general secretion pathway protein K
MMRIKRHHSRGGFALIMVMIAVITLSALVASLTLSMSTEIRLARNSDYDAEMEWMGRSGIELAEFALANKCPEQRSIDALNQYWAGGNAPCSNDVSELPLKDVPLGHGHISVTITDMERKWSINWIAGGPQPHMDILQRALNEVGVTDAGQASTIAESILDWCNPSGTARFSGAKDDYYMHLKPPYYCKDGQIDDLSELLLIKGVTPEIYWGSNATNHPVSAFQQHGGGGFANTTASGSGFRNNDEPVYPVGLHELFSPMGGKLNINTAPLKTLELIPGMDESTAAGIIRQRAGPDGIDGTDDDAPFMNIGEINGGMGGIGAPPANVPGAPPAGVAAQGLGAYIDVKSYVFEVKVEADIDGYKRNYYGIVSRATGGTRVQCVKFYWE